MGALEFYIHSATDTEARGPFSLKQLTSLAKSGGVTKETLCYDATFERWFAIGSNAVLTAVLWPEEKELSGGRTRQGTSRDRSMGANLRAGIPHGVETLLKKAAVDPAFRKLFLEDPAAVARGSGLELLPAEISMLESWPRDRLASVVDSVVVLKEESKILQREDGIAAYVENVRLRGIVLRVEDVLESYSAGVRPDRPFPWLLESQSNMSRRIILTLVGLLIAALVYGAIRLLS